MIAFSPGKIARNMMVALWVIILTVLPVPATVLAVIVNGDFSVGPQDPSFGWTFPLDSDVSVKEGRAILAEGGGSMALIQQTFTIPAKTPFLAFEVIDLDLRPNPLTELVDAFEVHLINAETDTALGEDLPFSNSTALFNFQQTGEVRYASNVSVAGAPPSGESWTDVPASFVVTVDLSSFTATSSVNATLSFILIGSGAEESSAAIDKVSTIAEPVAVNDAADTQLNEAVDIPVLDNDYDIDGTLDPTTVTVTADPGHGKTLVDGQTGKITYTPNPNHHGTDTFSYTVRDDQGNISNEAVVTVTVIWINQPPTARAGGDQTVNEGDVVVLDGSGSTDPDDGIASYLWGVVSATGFDKEAIVIADPSAVTTTFTAPQVGAGGGSVTLRLTVADTEEGGALSDDDEITITVQNVVIPGDVNDSGELDLVDLIVILKLSVQLPVTDVEITTEADVNGDGTLGPAEAIHILQSIANRII